MPTTAIDQLLADSLSDSVKIAAADSTWSSLCSGIESLDRLTP